MFQALFGFSRPVEYRVLVLAVPQGQLLFRRYEASGI